MADFEPLPFSDILALLFGHIFIFGLSPQDSAQKKTRERGKIKNDATRRDVQQPGCLNVSSTDSQGRGNNYERLEGVEGRISQLSDKISHKERFYHEPWHHDSPTQIGNILVDQNLHVLRAIFPPRPSHLSTDTRTTSSKPTSLLIFDLGQARDPWCPRRLPAWHPCSSSSPSYCEHSSLTSLSIDADDLIISMQCPVWRRLGGA